MSQALLCYAAREDYLSTAQIKLPASFVSPVALVPRPLRIRTKRTLHGDAASGLAVDIFCRHDLRRGDAVFDPMGHGGKYVVAGIGRWRDSSGDRRRVEGVRTGAAAAVSNARDHEQPGEILRLLQAAELFDEPVIEGRGLEGDDQRVRPSLIDDQFSAARLERAHIAGHRAVHRRPKLGVDLGHVPIDIKIAPVPVGPERPLEQTAERGFPRGALAGVSMKPQLKGPASLPGSHP